MPLILHTSNRIENLARRLVEVTEEQRLEGSLASETVMTLNPGIARWLQFEIAKMTGVSFGWDFPLPGKLFKRILAAFEPNFETAGDFPEDLARWHLFDLLSKLEDKPSFSQVRAYCQPGSHSRRLGFANRLARLYDEYLVYRPDEIIRWEDAPPTYDWQAELWRRLIKNLYPKAAQPRHIARIWHALAQQPFTPHSSLRALPPRLCIFGVSSLAPLYLDFLDTISNQIPIHIFLLQPSDLYWADLKTTKEAQKLARKFQVSQSETQCGPSNSSDIQRRSLGHPEEATRVEGPTPKTHSSQDWLYDTGNPLLPAFGKQSQMFLDLLIDKNAIQDDSAFVAPNESTQLSALQSDLFTLAKRDCESGDAPFPAFDGTLQIHSCASRRREVETIWDAIVHRLDTNPDLSPSQIIVMAPDIQVYRSHIEAVFQSKQGSSLDIPFSIADSSAASRSPVLGSLANLFKILGTRATSTDILALMETPLLREVFQYSDRDLESIEFWIRELGITWGWDSEHREQHQGFATNRNSWQEARIRLSAGLAFSSEFETPGGFDAYPEIESGLGETAGRFLECLSLLQTLRQSYKQSHSISAWRDRALELIEKLESKRDDWQREFQRAAELVRDTLPLLPNVFATGAEVFNALLDKLETASSSGGYLSGGVTFCSLKPMRSIPADTICLMGMNRLDFPRIINRLKFDLMATQNRIGDRNTRDEDRQFFLETILSARSHLIISYQGISSTNDSPKEPSVVLEELQAYLRNALTSEDFSKLKHTQKRLSFDPAYFQNNSPLFTYDPTRASLHQRSSAAPSAVSSTSSARGVTPFLESPATLHQSSTISLSSLIRFFQDPAKAFVLSTAKLRFVTAEEPLPQIDALKQNPLDRYQLRQALADAINSGNSLDEIDARDFLRCKLLPPGIQEVPTFVSELERAKDLTEGIALKEPVSARSELSFDRWTLIGECALQPDTSRQILVHGSELKSGRIVDAWIRHLFALNAVPSFSGSTCVYTLHDKAKHVEFTDVGNPSQELGKLISLYNQGQQVPLPLFPALARETFKYWSKENDEASALLYAKRKRASSETDSEYIRSFKWTPYDRACFGNDFELDSDFIKRAIDFWQPIEIASHPLKPPALAI